MYNLTMASCSVTQQNEFIDKGQPVRSCMGSL